jgi:hypothetical protein
VRWLLMRDPAGPFATQARLCTDRALAPEQVLTWFVRRWHLAVTVAQTRRQRGVATPRHWSHPGIQRTTPARLGRCARVTLRAPPQMGTAHPVRPAAWYHKSRPTVAAALAVVRRPLWGHTLCGTSPARDDVVAVPRLLGERRADALCDAAGTAKVELSGPSATCMLLWEGGRPVGVADGAGGHPR